MIQPLDKEIYTSILGKQYSAAIITYLQKCDIKPLKVSHWSVKMVQQIMNGITENLEVENAIIELVEKTIKYRAKLDRKKSKIQTSN